MNQIDNIDRVISNFIHKLEFGYLDVLILIPGTAFGVWGVPIFVIWYWYIYNSPLLLIAVVITVIINETIKHFVGRVRPDPATLGKKLINLRSIHNNPSMPSGDTAQASVTAITLIYHGYSYLWLLAIPFGAFGRIYFGSHWIGDCIIGGLVGAILAICVNYYLFDV